MVGVAVQEGLLRVDDLASRYKPSDVSGLKPEVTIRHLLTMSSGGTLMTKPSSQRPPKLSDALRPPGRGLDYVRLNEPEPGTPPGYGRTIPANSIFYYDGVPADHLADIVSSASGMRSIDYITRRLLQPLGVENFNYQAEGVDSNGNIRIGGSDHALRSRYGETGATLAERWSLGWPATGVGGLRSTVDRAVRVESQLRIPLVAEWHRTDSGRAVQHVQRVGRLRAVRLRRARSAPGGGHHGVRPGAAAAPGRGPVAGAAARARHHAVPGSVSARAVGTPKE